MGKGEKTMDILETNAARDLKVARCRYGRGGHLGHVTKILYTKFQYNYKEAPHKIST